MSAFRSSVLPSAASTITLKRLAISAAKPGGQDSQPVADQPLQPIEAPEGAGQGSQPATHQPGAASKENGKSPRALPRVTWDPFANVENALEQKQYAGRVRQHLEGACLLISSGTKQDSESGSEYVLTGFPGAADLPLDASIEFNAYSAGDVTLKNDTETKTVSILVYSSAQNPNSPQQAPNGQSAQIPQPAQPPPPPPKPGSWMWDQKGALDRGAYNRR